MISDGLNEMRICGRCNVLDDLSLEIRRYNGFLKSGRITPSEHAEKIKLIAKEIYKIACEVE